MKINRYKPSPLVDDRRPQKGSTTVGQQAENVWHNLKEGVKPESFAMNARRILGYKEDPEAVRKKISESIPSTKLRKRK